MNSSLSYSPAEIAAVAHSILAEAAQKRCRLFTLQGDLGAGKTTLCKALFEELGCKEPVISPTYAYMNKYQGYDADIYHFDLYRLSSELAFYQAGFDEYIGRPDSYVFLEWPEIINEVLQEQVVCRIYISYENELSRLIRWEVL